MNEAESVRDQSLAERANGGANLLCKNNPNGEAGNSSLGLRPMSNCIVCAVLVLSPGHVRSNRACAQEFFRMEATMTAIKKTPSVLGWYRILRAHYAFTFFQALRYALWLA
jgi:hypothetical protein